MSVAGTLASKWAYRWRCRRGERCARLVVTDGEAPDGSVLHVVYTCARCGTIYDQEVLIQSGQVVHANREIVGHIAPRFAGDGIPAGGRGELTL